MGYQKDQRPRNIPKVKLRGAVETINSQEITVLQEDGEGKILLATGTAAASTQDGQSRYAKGAFYIDTDVAGGTAGLYQNTGTSSSSAFTLLGAGDIESVTAGQGLVGGGASGAVTLNAGLNVYNDTGGTLAAGTLVALSSYDTTNGITVVKADASVGIIATHVVDTDINDASAGVVYPVATVTGLNTVGRTIGDAVYLDNASPGDFAYAPPSNPNHVTQIVGTVKVVDAAVGEIEFYPANRTVILGADQIKDSNGTAAKFIKKSALVIYDFANDGGAAGTIVLTDSETIPDNAVVEVESYEVVTTLTSATDASTVKLTLPTDGDLFDAVAISAAANPWDQGVHNLASGGALISSTPKKCTGARVPQLTVAGGENITAGKIIFQLSYWVSE